jgi:hypothetical protein
MQLTHGSKGAWFQPLRLSSEKRVSKFGFSKCNLHRYSLERLRADHNALEGTLAESVARLVRWGRIQADFGFYP